MRQRSGCRERGRGGVSAKQKVVTPVSSVSRRVGLIKSFVFMKSSTSENEMEGETHRRVLGNRSSRGVDGLALRDREWTRLMSLTQPYH